MTYISAEIRRQVTARAGNCCEYCRLSQEDNTFSFQVDHIIAEKHGGSTELDNLSWGKGGNAVTARHSICFL